MLRKKAKNRSKLLTHIVQTRVTKELYQKLKYFKDISNCWSMSEVVRNILMRKKIMIYYRNSSLDREQLELQAVCKQLKTIGRRINKLTRRFHRTENPSSQARYALLVADEYKKVGKWVDHLTESVPKLAEQLFSEEPIKEEHLCMGPYPLTLPPRYGVDPNHARTRDPKAY